MKSKYATKQQEIENRLREASKDNSNMEEWLTSGINILTSMGKFYTNVSIEGKQQLISSIFPENIQFLENECRTPRINEALRLMLLLDKGSSKNKLAQLPKKLVLSQKVPEVGIEPTLQRNTSLSRARLPIPPLRHKGMRK